MKRKRKRKKHIKLRLWQHLTLSDVTFLLSMFMIGALFVLCLFSAAGYFH